MMVGSSQSSGLPKMDVAGIGRGWTNWRKDVVWSIGILLLVLAIYWPSVGGSFIWNDSDYVTKPELRTGAGLRRIWCEVGATEQYYPLLHSALWLQCRVFGDDPTGYHGVTVLLHAAAAVLFGLTLRKLSVAGAWLAALLFAVHPVHVESVAWITEQKNTLSLVFYLLAALAYLNFDESRKKRSYFTACSLFVISLMVKTVTVTLPAALLVVLWWKRGSLSWRRDVLPLVPWLLTGAAAGLFSSWVERRYLGAEGLEFKLSSIERLLIAARAVWFYLGKLFCPTGLNFVYPRWVPDSASLFQWMFVAAMAVLIGGGLWFSRRNRAPLAVLLLFIGSLFPVLGFVNLYGAVYSWVWDHWQYLADLAPIALAAAVFTKATALSSRTVRIAAMAGASVVAAVLAVQARRHGEMFRDNETLYRTTIARNQDCWMAHSNLASLLRNDPARTAEALEHFTIAVRLRPDLAEVHANLGGLLSEYEGQLSAALSECEEALRLNPSLALAHFNLGVVLAKMPGRLADAMTSYRTALRLKPGYAEASLGLGAVLAGMPDRQLEAIAAYESAITSNPKLVEAHHGLALVLANNWGSMDEAIAHLEKAIAMAPGVAEAHNDLGMLLLKKPEKLAAATEEFREAIRLRPAYPEAHNNLANALARRSDALEEVVSHYQTALQLRPEFVEARFNLALVLLRSTGGRAAAIEQLEMVVQQRPDLTQAQELLQAIKSGRL